MVVDNFYSDPHAILNVLSGDYPIVGCGTGNRSIALQDIDQNLYNVFTEGIYKLHNIQFSPRLRMTSYFMEHSYNDKFESSWVHIDGKNSDACRMTVTDHNLILCGMVHLTENPDPRTGVSLYKLKDTINWSQQEIIDKTLNDYTIPRENYEAGKITLEQYNKLYEEYHSNFEMTNNFDNVFNRMVSWQGGTLHGQIMTKNMPKRLSQYFFVQYI